MTEGEQSHAFVIAASRWDGESHYYYISCVCGKWGATGDSSYVMNEAVQHGKRIGKK